MVTALLLDLDDTLVDTRAAMVAAGQAAVAQLWPDLGVELQHAAGVHFHGDPGGFFSRYTTGEMSFAQMRQARIGELLKSFSLLAGPEATARFEELYGPAFAANLRLFDDVWPFVAAADSARTRMGLLTNSSSEYTRQKLEVTGLAGVFAVVATRDTLGFGKPDAQAFQHACRLLGSPPAQTAYIGDHLEIDAVAAQDAGLHALWLQRDPGDTRATAEQTRARARGIPIVSSLRQVLAHLVLW